MTIWFLAFLALIWIAFFLPGAVRARRRTPLPAATRFKRAMAFIAPPRPAARHAVPRGRRPGMVKTNSGRWIVVPDASDEMKRRQAMHRVRTRRRRVLGLLATVSVATAAAAVARGGTWLEMHLIADGLLVFYLAMLYETKRRQTERAAKVRSISQRDDQEVRVLEPLQVGGGPT